MSSPGGGGSPGPATFSDGPRCTWTAATTRNAIGPAAPPGALDDPDLDPDAQITDGDGRLGWIRFCDDGAGPQFVWQASVDPIDLVGPAADRARAQLPLPTPRMSPPPDAGGIVNLGLWLAIDDPGTTTARASLTDAWAEVTGTLVEFAVDFGNGDTTSCTGTGVRIEDVVPDLDTTDPGPCGYTYLASSPDDRPYRMTYTITYAITWRTSDGRRGTLDPVQRAITFDYDVDEIQTVGRAG